MTTGLAPQTEKAEQTHGSSAVIDAFNLAMSSGWRGPGLERIRGGVPEKPPDEPQQYTEEQLKAAKELGWL